ncbi:hypothetical protein BDF20DRAFT_917319 [Mycotypha africana]|uniref:uncharacterized protein n=1 Tax=Mycotypha africana TaxID=64632 RepID=UPI00230181DC|nr:uncharacterized protein BDF20DRAFT_917319 [Mycotypha africana]KAI8967714.1 hypothetical protein BDF20DRAFT_917319 [Mycotypha africana]
MTTLEQQADTTAAPALTDMNVPTLPQQQANKDEYLVKTIMWKNKAIQIITQNENGPCPLVAICNVLFLRGDLEIRPPGREKVTFEYLVDRLANFLLEQDPFTSVPSKKNRATTAEEKTIRSGKEKEKDGDGEECTQEDTRNDGDDKERPAAGTPTESQQDLLLSYRHNLDDVLSILPRLKAGLDVNIQFSHSIRGFEPTAELAMFDLFHVDLVHGWLVDPDIQDKETYDIVVNQCKTYNNLVEYIVETTGTTTGTAVASGPDAAAEEEKLHQGFLANEFLNETATQLTYYGLSLLIDSIPENSLCVLFRNNHFSTIYRHSTLGLCMLVTDSSLVNERSIVWESLNDIDQGSSEFFDGYFRKSNGAPPDVEQEEEDLNYAIALSLEQQQQEQQFRKLQIQDEQQPQQHVARHENSLSAQSGTSNDRRDTRRSSAIAAKKKHSRNSQALTMKPSAALMPSEEKNRKPNTADLTSTAVASDADRKSMNKAKGKCMIM